MIVDDRCALLERDQESIGSTLAAVAVQVGSARNGSLVWMVVCEAEEENNLPRCRGLCVIIRR